MRVLKSDIKRLEELLKEVEVPMNYNRGRAKSADGKHGSHNPAGKGRSVLVGMIPIKNRPSNFTLKHPAIHEELQKLAAKYAPFPVKSFMLNKNYQTQPHYDSLNVGKSVIFSFGDYEGGELVIEGKVVDTRMKTLLMDGSSQKHWNKPILNGTKYSIIFFNA